MALSGTGKLHKAKAAFKSIHSKFEHSIEKHQRINKKYILAKNVVNNIKLKVALETNRLLGKPANFDQSTDACPYGDGLLKQSPSITKDDIKHLYNDLSVKDSTNDNESTRSNLDFTIANGKRIFSFANDSESISLNGLSKKMVRNKGRQHAIRKRTTEKFSNKTEGSVAANYLLDILEKQRNRNTDTHEKLVSGSIDEDDASEEVDNEDIIILTDDIVTSSDEEVVYSENEKNSDVDISDELSGDDVPILSDEVSDEQDVEIQLSSDDHPDSSIDIEENINDSDCVSETSILEDEESFLINDMKKEDPVVYESNNDVYEFPLGEHIGEYKKNDIIDASKYETYVGDFKF